MDYLKTLEGGCRTPVLVGDEIGMVWIAEHLEYAKIQILTTSKGIQEISNALNFGNRTYFSRVFREITGATPVAFRNQMGREKEDETAEETETED